jgi:two-component system LytT family response regulator
MIRAVIVDDESKNRSTLQQLLERYCPEVEAVASEGSIDAAEKAIKAHSPDLIFLDVEMPFGSGFDLLERFPQPSFYVIFITAFNHYAMRAIKMSAADYLLKPVDIDELKEAVKKVSYMRAKEQQPEPRLLEALLNNIRAGKSAQPKLAVPGSDGILYIEITNIVRCTADGNYTLIYTTDGQKLHVAKTLKEYEDLLSTMNFFRVHNSCLVNLQHVTKYIRGEGGQVVMSDGAIVEVSRRRKSELLERLSFNSF